MSNFSNSSSDFNLELWSATLIDTFQMETKYGKTMMVAFMAIIFILSLFGNLLICYVIYNDKTMHTVTNYYLFNLAISDVLLTCVIVLDLGFYFILAYPQSEWMCRIQWLSVSCLWSNAMLTMTALGIERYIAILHPLRTKSTQVWKRVVKIIVLMWVLAIVLTLPEMLIVTLLKSRRATACFVIPTLLTRTLNGVLAIVTFFIPFIIMVFVYSMIVYKVNTRQKNLGRRDTTRKMNRITVAMMASFLICWMPYFVERLFMAALNPRQILKYVKWWSIILRVVYITGWLSVILNPLIFSLVSTKFRKALKTLWNVKIRRIPNLRRSRSFMEINKIYN